MDTEKDDAIPNYKISIAQHRIMRLLFTFAIIAIILTAVDGAADDAWKDYKLDYRAGNCLTPVKDQGHQVINLFIYFLSSLNKLRLGGVGVAVAGRLLRLLHSSLLNVRSMALAEQQLVDCDNGYNRGCNGGLAIYAWKYLKTVAGGSAKQSFYPYTATSKTCKFNTSMIGAKISTFVAELPKLNATNMQSAIQTYGPIQAYRSGIYNDVACSSVKTTNHAVVAVGWGKGNGIDYWIIRNSWGTGWGISGYIKMQQRGVNLCNIEQHPAAITAVV
ncbi:hypothetical protein DAPPUDRAFT_267532 [Daphnia pulex]|uniref:Peptidase C1A papain C-terminal domain-containing protein n=1 Tax=Daphnia pulex TaxID=6669 RepID=E9HWL7_DAPPU|nr:hypothetical protein DAPPUDRAFT_267532 [Daphnia pulex]|eukprot:EFX63858.1 hypothetical protein DAPPUDRAFT_267532 [Daphnia pulex]